MEKHTNTKDQFYLKACNDLECKRVCQRVSDERRGLKNIATKSQFFCSCNHPLLVTIRLGISVQTLQCASSFLALNN